MSKVIHLEKAVFSGCIVEAAVLARRNTALNARNAHNLFHDRMGQMISNLRGRTPQAIFCPSARRESAGATKADARLGRARGFRWVSRSSGLSPAIAPPNAQICANNQGYSSLSFVAPGTERENPNAHHPRLETICCGERERSDARTQKLQRSQGVCERLQPTRHVAKTSVPGEQHSHHRDALKSPRHPCISKNSNRRCSISDSPGENVGFRQF